MCLHSTGKGFDNLSATIKPTSFPPLSHTEFPPKLLFQRHKLSCTGKFQAVCKNLQFCIIKHFFTTEYQLNWTGTGSGMSCHKNFQDAPLIKKHTESRAVSLSDKFRKISMLLSILQCSVKTLAFSSTHKKATCKRAPCMTGNELQGRNCNKKSVNILLLHMHRLCYSVNLIFKSCSTSAEHRQAQSSTWPATTPNYENFQKVTWA